MILCLVSDDPWSAELVIDLRVSPVVIGRSEGCDVRIDDRWISRSHCRIESIDQRVVVTDLQSRHGTYIGKERILQAELRDGDRLALGSSQFVARFSRVLEPVESV